MKLSSTLVLFLVLSFIAPSAFANKPVQNQLNPTQKEMLNNVCKVVEAEMNGQIAPPTNLEIGIVVVGFVASWVILAYLLEKADFKF